jgi:hypothetical protein
MSLLPRISKIYLKLIFYSALAEAAKETNLAQAENFGGIDGIMY